MLPSFGGTFCVNFHEKKKKKIVQWLPQETRQDILIRFCVKSTTSATFNIIYILEVNTWQTTIPNWQYTFFLSLTTVPYSDNSLDYRSKIALEVGTIYFYILTSKLYIRCLILGFHTRKNNLVKEIFIIVIFDVCPHFTWPNNLEEGKKLPLFVLE